MRLPYILLLLLLAVNAKAQNVVPNASFEQFTTCPTGISQMNSCTGWRQYTGGSSDYFHNCNAGMIPAVLLGWQQPAHGDAFIGLYLFSSTSPTIYKEYAATTIPALTIGAAYEVSMSVSLANYASYGCNDLGVFFYDSGPATVATNTALPVTPQISYYGYGTIMDTQNWVRVIDTFVADSAYDNIVIGGFKQWSAIGATDTIRQNPGSNSYYYIDSIVIRLVDTLSFVYDDTLLCLGDSIIVPYKANPGMFASNNVFTLQLSNASGSFASPVTIATLASNTSGTLKGVVPASVTGGAGYRLRIISSNPVKTVVSTKDISIGLSQPAKPVAIGNSPVCGGQTLFLTASTSSTGVTWQWTGPSFTATVQNTSVPNFGTGNAGDYIVTVSNFGCQAKDTITIAYQPGLVPVNATNSGPVCAGGNISLSTTATNQGAAYSWIGPGNYTSLLQNPSITGATLSMSGDYIVTATLNGCSVSDTTTLLVKPVPSATAAISGPVCEGASFSLTGTSSLSGSSFAWSGPSGYSSNLQNPSISPVTIANQGIYMVVTTKDGCNSQPATVQAVVYPTPAKPVANANSIMCDGSPLNLSTAFVLNATYSWTGPNGFTSTLQNPIINPATFIHAGYYKLQTSVNGCLSEKDSVNVTVNIIPKIGGWASPNDTICEGTLTTYVSIHSNGGVNPVLQWYKNYQPIPGANSILYTTSNLKTGDVLYCTMYSVGVCTDPVTVSTDTISMVVLPIVTQPSATITSVPAVPQPYRPVTFTAHAVNGGPDPKYQWQLNGVNQIGATYATWSANVLKPFDKVNAIVTSNDPCATNKTASSDTITVGFPTTVGNTNANTGFQVYPNPNDGNFTITAGNIAARSVKLELVNTVGQVVYKEEINTVNKQVNHDIKLNGLPDGIYLLKLYNNGMVNTVKLTIR